MFEFNIASIHTHVFQIKIRQVRAPSIILNKQTSIYLPRLFSTLTTYLAMAPSLYISKLSTGLFLYIN